MNTLSYSRVAGVLLFCSTFHVATSLSMRSVNSTLPNCNDLADQEGKFFVTGTRGNGMRGCNWALRQPEKEAERCNLEVVKQNCPKSCNVQCATDKGGAVTLALQEDSFDTVSEPLIIVLSLAFVAIGAFVATRVLKRDKRFQDRQASIQSISDSDSDVGLNKNSKKFEFEEGVSLEEKASRDEGGEVAIEKNDRIPIDAPPRQDSVSTNQALKRAGICDGVCPSAC